MTSSPPGDLAQAGLHLSPLDLPDHHSVKQPTRGLPVHGPQQCRPQHQRLPQGLRQGLPQQAPAGGRGLQEQCQAPLPPRVGVGHL